MLNQRSRRRPVKLLMLLAGVALVSLTAAAFAAALPGDPPIVNQAPDNGPSVPAVAEGLKVGFTCPAYRTAEIPLEFEEGEEKEGEKPKEKKEREKREAEEREEFEEREEVETVVGGAEEYGVNFSTSPTPGADGRLTTAGFGEAGEGEAEAVKGTPNCNSELELPTVPNPAVLYSGRVYWQAYRECEGCETGFETGPVGSFVVVPTVEEAEINFENHIFGGYLTKVVFTSANELKGTTIQLQEWNGSAWAPIASEPGNNAFENSFFVKLEAGHRLLRPVVVGTGVAVPLEQKARTVRKSKGSPPPLVKTGTWEVAGNAETREEEPLTFKVTKGGTMLEGLIGYAEAICRGPAKGESVTIESTAVIHKARIAPDGTVVAISATHGASPGLVNLTGNFFNGRFTGEINSTFANCAGFRQFEAALAPPKKK